MLKFKGILGGSNVAGKSNLDDYRKLIGYLIITFVSVFIFFPFLWLANLWGGNEILYSRWALTSLFLVGFNLAFYYWKYPKNWFNNLLVLAGIDLIIVLIEYLWLIS